MKLNKSVSVFLALLILLTTTFTLAYAAEGDAGGKDPTLPWKPNADGGDNTGDVGKGNFNTYQSGFRVTLLDGDKLFYPDACVDLLFTSPPQEKGNTICNPNKLGNAKADRQTKALIPNIKGLAGMPYPIGWKDEVLDAAGNVSVPGEFTSGGNAIRDYLVNKNDPQGGKMGVFLEACFKDKHATVIEDIKAAEDPRVLIEAVVWYKPVTTGKAEVSYWVYGTSKNIAQFNIANVKLLGDADGAQMCILTNRALPKCMVTAKDDDVLNIDTPKNLKAKNIPSSDLVK